MREQALKKRILLEAAMWFAERGGKIPSTYTALCLEVPHGKPRAVTRRKWSKFYTSWGHFKKSIETSYPDLLKLAQNVEEQVEVEIKDPLETLRASSKKEK